MKVAITGGAGFLGTALARRLLAADAVTVNGAQHPLDELVVADLVPPPSDLTADSRVVPVVGELTDALDRIAEADLVFHLAGVVSGAAEADFDLGMATNVNATLALLEACRRSGRTPVVVFSSSLAVFGAEPADGPLRVVSDDTLPRPQTSYGIQKFIGEQLIADFTRKGFLDGRSVRLITVTVRPGRPNAAASSFLSGIIREPLAGERAVCPVPPDTPVAISSPRRTLDGILAAAAATQATWGGRTAVTLPALSTTPAEMVDALARVGGEHLRDLIDWTPDPTVAAMVTGWPAEVRATRAAALGLLPETSVDDIVRAYLDDRSR